MEEKKVILPESCRGRMVRGKDGKVRFHLVAVKMSRGKRRRYGKR